jgi:hypothetical protein
MASLANELSYYRDSAAFPRLRRAAIAYVFGFAVAWALSGWLQLIALLFPEFAANRA